MSTGTRISLADAIANAERFRSLFNSSESSYARWEFAGSIRRKCADVGDVEHAIIPTRNGLFGSADNLLWKKLDGLVQQGIITKKIYGDTGPRWGEKYRGVIFDGIAHELWTAESDTWGSILAIRTGPAAFSRQLVTGLLHHGRRNKDGAVWRCNHCECSGRDKRCHACEGTGLIPAARIAVLDEGTYFGLCGVSYREPEDRK